jgi:predicted dehydrogenase
MSYTETVARSPTFAAAISTIAGETSHAVTRKPRSSYAVAASRAPLLELHGERGSISIAEAPPLTDAGPVDLHLDGDWITDARPPVPPRAADSMIGVGVAHFVGCLTGREAPVLTADRALHVLEIARVAERSAACGEALALETSFAWS